MPRPGLSVLTLSIVLVFTAAACSNGEPAPEPPEPETAEVQTFVVRGIFARAEKEGQAMHVRHEEIPGFMASMAMNFRLDNAVEIAGLEYGDKIEFTLVVDDIDLLARDIKKLPPETELDLGN